MTSILLDVYRRPTPWSETHHRVRLYPSRRPDHGRLQPRRYVTTTSVNGLCYVVGMNEAHGRPMTGRWLLADGQLYFGDRAIRWWVQENLPESLAQARRVIARRLAEDDTRSRFARGIDDGAPR